MPTPLDQSLEQDGTKEMTEQANMSGRKRSLLRIGALFFAATLAGCQTPPPVHGLNPTQVAELRHDGFVESDDGWTLGLSDELLFRLDDDQLTSGSHDAVLKLGHSLVAIGIQHLRVLGYTDSLGSDAYNDALSARRAAAVADALISTGLAPGNIQQRGLGKRNPVADNSTPAGRAQNRRVAIVVEAE
jgi:outer membrane protein OmpA-like peptidoglycan-associated protein